MPQSAECTFAAVEAGGVFNYDVMLRNTSTEAFDIYSFLFGNHYNVPPVPFPLQNVVPISAPNGWLAAVNTVSITWGTNWTGDPVDTGYIQPGGSGHFLFQSSTPPPDEILFGCVYYSNDRWGFNTNGTSKRVTIKPPYYAHINPPYYAHINPLALLLRNDLFVRINLPRPAFDRAGLLSQLESGIRAMTSAEREIAIRALDAHIMALTEVRGALERERGESSRLR